MQVCFMKVLEADEEFVPAWFNLGMIYRARKQQWKAIHFFERVRLLLLDAIFFQNRQIKYLILL